jgi:hypothetical protein
MALYFGIFKPIRLVLCKLGFHSFMPWMTAISRSSPYYGKWVKHTYCRVCNLHKQVRTQPNDQRSEW